MEIGSKSVDIKYKLEVENADRPSVVEYLEEQRIRTLLNLLPKDD